MERPAALGGGRCRRVALPLALALRRSCVRSGRQTGLTSAASGATTGAAQARRCASSFACQRHAVLPPVGATQSLLLQRERLAHESSPVRHLYVGIGALAVAVGATAGSEDGSLTAGGSAMMQQKTKSTPLRSFAMHEGPMTDVYEITDEIIGEGGYCVVHRGVDRRTGDAVAVKMLSKMDTPAREFWTEVDVLRTAGKHPNIVELRDVFETEDFWYIVQDLASHGELFDQLVANGPYSEQQASESIRELCDALQYLHRKGIVHGDIKPENILLDNGRMCLVDFGVSFRVGERVFGDPQLTGTVAYAAPETLIQETKERGRPRFLTGDKSEDSPGYESNVGPKADMFALGIVLYILLCGSHPFDPYNNLTDEEIRQRIIKAKFQKQSRAWHSISPLARDLIEKLLEPNPDKRLSSHEAMHHPWLMQGAELSREPMRDSAELLKKFQRGRRRLRASIIGALLMNALNESDESATPPVEPKRDLAWGLSSSVDAMTTKTQALLSALNIFDKDRKGFITRNDLARVSAALGTNLSENDLNEMLVGSTGDPEEAASAVDAITYEDVKMAISSLKSASFRPGESIIREGNVGGHNVYLLLDGRVEVSIKNPAADAEEEKKKKGFFRSQRAVKSTDKEEEEIVLRHLEKGSFFGELELVRPDGLLHPRIATYRCDPEAPNGCKVLLLVAADYLNVGGFYESVSRRLSVSTRRHAHQRLIKCIEAAKGSMKKRSFEPGEFVYREGEACDSFFIVLDGEVEVLRRGDEPLGAEPVVIEELHEGDYFPLGVSGQTKHCSVHTRHTSVKCTKPTHVIEIGGEAFRSFLHSNQFMASFYTDEVQAREQSRLEKLKTRESKA